MELSSRKYARKILLFHGALLLLTLLLIFFGGQAIYDSARQQVTAQAFRRQALLANQTAAGIESFYTGILSDLDLLQRSEYETSTTQPGPTQRPQPGRQPADRQIPGAPLQRGRNFIFARTLWRQLDSRASALLLFDRTTGNLTSLGNRPDAPAIAAIQSIVNPFLRDVKGKSVSPFFIVGESKFNLVCIPADPQDNRILAALVPVGQIDTLFFKHLNTDAQTGATLRDEEGHIMANNHPELIGMRVDDLPESSTKSEIEAKLATSRAFEVQTGQGAAVRGVTFAPALLAFEPIELPGKQWWVNTTLPTSEVDGVLNQIFRRALIWGAFVAASITAILVSTSILMIRNRMRIERFRHDVVTRELQEARRIQLAWLPASDPPHHSVDIAAVNQPASHISGDFYNWFDLPDGRTVVTIGDVTGHGMSAAFLMATVQLLVKTTMLRIGDPGKAMEDINRQLCLNPFNGQFVTMLVLAIDPLASEVTIAVAGHPAPMLFDGKAAKPLQLEPHLVLGVECDTKYASQRFHLHPGTHLLLYTDGVVDAVAPNGRRLTAQGLRQMARADSTSARTFLDGIVSRLHRFRESNDLVDDLTLVAIARMKGQPVAIAAPPQ